MILRDLVGGGGRAKSSFEISVPDWIAGRLRDKSAGDGGESGWYDESEPLAEGVEERLLMPSASRNAVGGRLKAGAPRVPSLPRISLDEPGVGGAFGRGIAPPSATWAVEMGETLGTGRRA